jgi:hypothetical protein
MSLADTWDVNDRAVGSCEKSFCFEAVLNVKENVRCIIISRVLWLDGARSCHYMGHRSACIHQKKKKQ